jgi:hypothetical protein
LHAPEPSARLAPMATVESGIASAFVDAIVARDVSRAVALLHPEIDFRAMTPNRVCRGRDVDRGGEVPVRLPRVVLQAGQDAAVEVVDVRDTRPAELTAT